MQKHLVPRVNEYMFNKKESIVVDFGHEKGYLKEGGFASQYAQVRMISGMLCNLHDLGYTIPREELPKLYTMTERELCDCIYQPLLQAAKEAKGAHVEHRVLFPGFPDSVRQLDVQTLSDIRFMSYFTTFIDSIQGIDPLGDGSLNKEFVKTAVQNAMDTAAKENDVHSVAWALNHQTHSDNFYRSANELVDSMLKKIDGDAPERMPRVVHLVDESAYFDMVKNMLSARTSLSTYDQSIVRFTMDNFEAKDYMPDKIQFKETQSMVDKYNFERGRLENINVKSINDFERLLVSLSDGDTSLSSKQMIRNFSNQERKKLAEIFNNAIRHNRPIMIESMANRQSLRFAENVLKNRLHLDSIIGARTYKKLISQAQEHQNVMSRFEQDMKRGMYVRAAETLADYSPTLLVQHARNIVGQIENRVPAASQTSLNIKHKIINNVTDTISACAHKVDIKTLMNADKEVTRERLPYKIMMPKSPTASVLVKENTSQPLSDYASCKISEALKMGIKYQIQNHEMTGSVQIKEGTRVYIDPALQDCPIPTVGRNDTGKNRTVAPGTKLPVEQGNILRAALYKQNDQDQFIDFSAAFFDKNFRMVGQVSWNNLKEAHNGRQIAYHSGDTRACSGKGCTEIIDIDLNAAKSAFPEAQHVAYMAVMWDGNPLSSCNQLFMTLSPTQELGMENGQPLAGKAAHNYSYTNNGGQNLAFDPANVQFKIDITGDGRASIPMFYNIDTGKAMVVNMESKFNSISSAVSQNVKHFDLPASCQAIENYSSDIALKCFAYDSMDMPSIAELANYYVEFAGAKLVSKPGMSDVAFMVDRTPFDDIRYHEEGEEIVPATVVTPFDKDVITAELIIDPKSIDIDQRGVEKTHEGQAISQEFESIEIQ